MIENIVLRKVEDKYSRFLNYEIFDNTGFLNLAEQVQVLNFVNEHKAEGVYITGGYEDSERKMIVFIPEYLDVNNKAGLYELLCNREISPIRVLRFNVKGLKPKKLTHRDYLGALLAEGVKREKIGDILVGENQADVIVQTEIAEYLKQNMFKVGSCSIDCKEMPLKEILERRENSTEIRVSVPSVRLDNMISKGFNISRSQATEAINRGIVYVNDFQAFKTDLMLKGGEKLVLRGKGKIIYKGEKGLSKKGKTIVALEKYV